MAGMFPHRGFRIDVEGTGCTGWFFGRASQGDLDNGYRCFSYSRFCFAAKSCGSGQEAFSVAGLLRGADIGYEHVCSWFHILDRWNRSCWSNALGSCPRFIRHLVFPLQHSTAWCATPRARSACDQPNLGEYGLDADSIRCDHRPRARDQTRPEDGQT